MGELVREDTRNMKNCIYVKKPRIENNRITYDYELTGEWEKIFEKDNKFSAEYDCDISMVPEGIAIIPLLGNILPISWVYDACIYIETCDKDFYESISEFKKGYQQMFPMMDFEGKLEVSQIQFNEKEDKNVGAFFSGGADAFNTLVCHAEEKPVLMTLWGADVKWDDEAGWNRVANHLKDTTREFNVESVIIKSNLRDFVKEYELNEFVAKSGDSWWHGFQHGLGIICHAAPVAYTKKMSIIYFASSFTIADKGKVTCASDPTIDNFIKFCGTNIFHDGYEYTRQMKIRNIVNYSNEQEKEIALRVCWQSSGGANCCNCEKCWRTILGIFAEGENPRKFGFNYTDFQLAKIAGKMKYGKDKIFSELRYRPIQEAMRENCNREKLPFSIRWFYDVDITKIDKSNLIKEFFYSFDNVYRRAKSIVKKLLLKK